MAGRDQSANLGGMLSQIGTTLSDTGMGESFKDLMINTRAPAVDPNDPESVERAAQYASRTGNAQQAALYMQQARVLRAEQKEQKTMNNMGMTDKATMTGDMTAQQVAASGDVTNLDRSIAALRDSMQGEFPSVQARNYAKQNLERLESMRSGAVSQQTSNNANAVVNIDKALDSGVTPAANKALLERKEELLKDPEVQKAVTANELAQFQAEKAQQEMENKAYIQKNMPALREAVGDPNAAQDIIANAPASAQLAVQSAYNSMQQFQTGIDEVQANFEVVATPSDFDMINEKIDAIPEELQAGATESMELLREAESFRDSDGRPLTEGHAIRIKKARSALTSKLVAAQNAIGQQEYAARRAEERREEDAIAELEIQRDTFRPDDVAVERRAEMLAKEAGDYIKVGADKKGKGGRTVVNTGPYMEDAAASLRQEHRTDVDKQIAIKTGEVAETREFTESEEARIQEGIRKTGATRDAVINHLDANDLWSPTLEEVTVPDRKRRSVEAPVNREGATALYKDSFITQGLDAVGDFFDDRGRRAKEKLRDNPYG